jgi:rhodanese-related sulfurtransferase
MMAGAGRRQTLAELLDEARARVERVDPPAAQAAVARGALLIDIRSTLDRERDGIVPGSLHIPRTVLEWRLDPDGEWRNPHVDGLERRIVLLCDHGCSSLLAAATLSGLGFARVGDVIGGFAAWKDAGLPTTQPQPYQRDSTEPAGMGPPDP